MTISVFIHSLPSEIIHTIVSFVYDDIDIRRAMNIYGKLRNTCIYYDHIVSLLEKTMRQSIPTLSEYKRYDIPNAIHISTRASKKVMNDTITFRVKDFTDPYGDFLLYEFAMYRLKRKTDTKTQEKREGYFKADFDDYYWEITRYKYKLLNKKI